MNGYPFFSQHVVLISIMAFSMMSNTYATLPNKTLIYCFEADPAGFDPGQYVTSVEYSASAETVYNRLVHFERGSTKLEPGLAQSWELSEDGRIVTFHLRRGVKFHTTPWFKPTRDFNAEDVLFTFERMRNPKMPFRRAYPTEFPYWHFAGFDKIIEKIEAPNPYTVRFTLQSANAPFLSNLATYSMSILSSEYAAQLLKAGKPSEINRKPVGTGPFIFRKYVKDATIHFDGNPDYWNPTDVQLSKLIFAITPDAAVRTQKLKAHECQVSVYPNSADIAALQADPQFRVLSQPGFSVGMLFYNVTHPPLDDVRIRRALDMAIDKQAIVDAVFEGRAQVAVAPMPPLQWSYDKTLQDTPRDLEQAKTLLAQAGYPDGFSISLLSMPIQRPYNPNSKLMAEMIQADWAKIGVKAKIVTYEWGEYIRRMQNGEHDAALGGDSVDNGDPGSWFKDLRCSDVAWTRTKWCYQPLEDLLQQAVQTTDISQRTQLYLQAQKMFKREQPLTPIAYPIVYQPIHKNVTGFKINPFGPTQFAGVGLKEDDKAWQQKD